MTNPLRIITVVSILAFAASFLLLRLYKLELVEGIVLNTVLQKVPSDYPGGEVRWAFARARLEAEARGCEEAYVEHLLALSQRLEKIQYLNHQEVKEVLEALASECTSTSATDPKDLHGALC